MDVEPEFPTEFVVPASLAHDLYNFLRRIATWQIQTDEAGEVEGSRLFEALGEAMYPEPVPSSGLPLFRGGETQGGSQ